MPLCSQYTDSQRIYQAWLLLNIELNQVNPLSKPINNNQIVYTF
ncbi:hypothetical protein [Thiomicrorhabdus lithotrophica]|uniref:Uncharacterized protein n=1 Tax=Thiomicrorhabdus lithotrophica TaxID=2949997 RepID=A0ABY8C8J2_9GAMM|nr:hypothetical protein [Thiomicrorhabdus lithotrophica]WEJ62239.1 hypothetical protein NR989_09485 [Thiomicrorhabdus lithotrophica]